MFNKKCNTIKERHKYSRTISTIFKPYLSKSNKEIEEQLSEESIKKY